MDRIDVLGEEYDGYQYMTGELLAETDDQELQSIVENAARELDSPMALVSLILDRIQFFKAHVGLPDILVATRATHRDVSFCQFVVKDGKAFEVNDGPNDNRIPQQVVKEYNIQSYLGIPIQLEGTVVGSLCVLDTKKRQFTDKDRKSLNELAVLVNKRLAEITSDRRRTQLDLAQRSLSPAMSELMANLQTLDEHVKNSLTQIASIRSFLDLFEQIAAGNLEYTDTAEDIFDSAKAAHEELAGHLSEVEIGLWDGFDNLKAVHQMMSGGSKVEFSEIVTTAQEITRNATNDIGGFRLPAFQEGVRVHTNSKLSIALVANCLLLMCTEVKARELVAPIESQEVVNKDRVELRLSSKGLDTGAYQTVCEQVNMLIERQYPSVNVNSSAHFLSLQFKIAR